MCGFLLFTFEGIDACSKQTQCDNLVNYLEKLGFKTKLFSFPRYNTMCGDLISRFLKGQIKDVPHELICLAYASDRKATTDEIIYYLKNDYVVIADRYTYSNLFSIAKLPEEQWAEQINWLERLEFKEFGIIKPNCNFYLYIDPLIAQQRLTERYNGDESKKDIYENNILLQNNVSQCYLKFAQGKEDWRIINQMNNDKQLSKEEVFELIKKEINKLIGV